METFYLDNRTGSKIIFLIIFPQVTISWRHPWKTDGNTETIQEARHEVSIPLISGIAGSAVIVLLVALFIGLFTCRERKEK